LRQKDWTGIDLKEELMISEKLDHTTIPEAEKIQIQNPMVGANRRKTQKLHIKKIIQDKWNEKGPLCQYSWLLI